MPSPTCLPAAAAQRGWQLRHTRRCRRGGTVLAAAGRQQAPQADPYAVLKVGRGSSRRAIRAAYIEQIKLLHPDVSASGEDTTREAAALNAAYEALMAGFDSNSRDDSEDEEYDPLEVFDLPEAEPDRLFVDPFAVYGVSPIQWEALQEAGRAAAAAGQDPWMALRQQGVQASEAAFVWLSPRQLEILTDELQRASDAFDASAMEAAAFFVSDCLMRARVANNRVGAGAGRW